MRARRTVVTQASTRSPRDDWRKPRRDTDCVAILEANNFVESNSVIGVAFVRVVGLFALRVTFAQGRATLETATRSPDDGGVPVRWRPSSGGSGSEPWQVTRDALELLATLSVDTPVRWG